MTRQAVGLVGSPGIGCADRSPRSAMSLPPRLVRQRGFGDSDVDNLQSHPQFATVGAGRLLLASRRRRASADSR